MIDGKLTEIAAISQDIVPNITLRETTTCCFYILFVFLQLEQMRYKVLISKILKRKQNVKLFL